MSGHMDYGNVGMHMYRIKWVHSDHMIEPKQRNIEYSSNMSIYVTTEEPRLHHFPPVSSLHSS